ncbi:MAG: ferritin [Candidatus Marinimicrobia bacterium]|jgi:ferritin|nr:ferritin [Candidatus Neomarinimicrobiota bacterium]
MISKKLEKALNEQINKELYSEYYYLGMAAWFSDQGLDGFANFFKVQVQEERFHAMKMFDYLINRGGKVALEAIQKPPQDFESAEDIFKKAYEHEQFVTKSINDLMDLAIAENDHATRNFLNWFVEEQVEEEASMDELLTKVRMIGSKGHGMLMLDGQLAQRAFNPVESEA